MARRVGSGFDWTSHWKTPSKRTPATAATRRRTRARTKAVTTVTRRRGTRTKTKPEISTRICNKKNKKKRTHLTKNIFPFNLPFLLVFHSKLVGTSTSPRTKRVFVPFEASQPSLGAWCGPANGCCYEGSLGRGLVCDGVLWGFTGSKVTWRVSRYWLETRVTVVSTEPKKFYPVTMSCWETDSGVSWKGLTTRRSAAACPFEPFVRSKANDEGDREHLMSLEDEGVSRKTGLRGSRVTHTGLLLSVREMKTFHGFSLRKAHGVWFSAFPLGSWEWRHETLD